MNRRGRSVDCVTRNGETRVPFQLLAHRTWICARPLGGISCPRESGSREQQQQRRRHRHHQQYKGGAKSHNEKSAKNSIVYYGDEITIAERARFAQVFSPSKILCELSRASCFRLCLIVAASKQADLWNENIQFSPWFPSNWLCVSCQPKIAEVRMTRSMIDPFCREKNNIRICIATINLVLGNMLEELNNAQNRSMIEKFAWIGGEIIERPRRMPQWNSSNIFRRECMEHSDSCTYGQQ